MDVKNDHTDGLRSVFTPLGIWSFSIGTSIGWGSFIVTCNTYLMKSGLLGTVFGMLAGMAVILVITWNLQYMICSSPDAGGIYSFGRKTGGKDMGFLAFWFVLLTYYAILWANMTSVPLFLRFFMGDTFQFGFHYSIFGYEVWLGEALLSIAAVVLAGLLCSKSSRITNRIMITAAVLFAAGFTICALIALFRHERGFSYSPLYIEGSSAFSQIVRIAAISPWAFIGFENISHFSEEYTFPLKKVRRILVSSVVITTVLYIFVSLLSVSAYPAEYGSWLEYIQDMGNLEGIKAVPAFYAAWYYLGQGGVTVLMVSLFGVIVTSLIGNMLALSRIVYAAGRDGEASPKVAELNAQGIPHKAIFFITAFSVLIPFLGRTAIGWIVDVTTLGATLIYGMISLGVFLHTRRSGNNKGKIFGMAGLLLMIIFMLLLLVPGLLPFHAMETESYALFIVWSLLGLVYYRALLRRDHNREYGLRIIVWILLLMLVLFASLMWVSRITEKVAKESAEEILKYHESHQADDSVEEVREDRLRFLETQADKIGSTNTIYTLVSLGLFLLSAGIILHNYMDTQKLGDRLTAAEEEARAAKKIAELKQSISSLMDNMPGLNFAKDAETGVYLACNQAFADYANMGSPEAVIGHSDDEIFDPATAVHFEEDDRMALSMDEPFVIYEDVLDGEGHSRQFQTTKLKYVDDSGRLCVLGMSQDVTDLVRIRRENASTREAYEKMKSSGIIYTHMAQTLARGYEDLFYVNLETGEFREYLPGDENSVLTEKRREGNFFEKCMEEIDIRVHPDDRDVVKKALEKDRLIDHLERNGSLIMTYRLLSDESIPPKFRSEKRSPVSEDREAGTGDGSVRKDAAVYVTMKVSRMLDDDRYVIFGISNTDEQMKIRRAAERMREESIAYARISALSGEYLCIYIVDPESGRYREYRSNTGFAILAIPKEGNDFFGSSREKGGRIIYEEDRERFLAVFTKENVLEEVERSGFFTLTYRLALEAEPIYVRLKAVMLREKEGMRLIVGVSNIDAYVKQEEEYAKRLEKAHREAVIDPLTGVRNRNAYLETEEQLDRQIEEEEVSEFAIVVLDVNDLKKVNDTLGHQAGDQFICDACRIICDIFKRSPVFRIGGDEFTVVAQGDDYENVEELMQRVAEHNARANETGGIVIACGMARYENDASVAPVYERADHEMYENKNSLKSKKRNGKPKGSREKAGG